GTGQGRRGGRRTDRESALGDRNNGNRLNHPGPWPAQEQESDTVVGGRYPRCRSRWRYQMDGRREFGAHRSQTVLEAGASHSSGFGVARRSRGLGGLTLPLKLTAAANLVLRASRSAHAAPAASRRRRETRVRTDFDAPRFPWAMNPHSNPRRNI